ncbi:sensor domain-containing phosphodiesterase [Cellulomonas sp. NS3]|uniref:sensor domain-containing phosphodiesterase n=1 Tax=Cellulomonas sp. NS3 TaxID=2973977 RepID=UPI0021632BD7|nr:EAL domain-containing protein [Cellulomonas sp. NS3]
MTSAPSRRTATPTRSPLDDVLTSGALHSVYQPLVDLRTGATLGHEALLRGPAGTPWSSPLTLLEDARAAGRLVELERASLTAAFAGAAGDHPAAAATLFVNVEPQTLTQHLEPVLELLDRRPDGLQVVVEITERALAAEPARILAAADRLRTAGCAIALDDVGARPASLAFVPLLRPEVVKLDLGLLRTLEDPQTVVVAGAVRDYAEQSGAEVVAEGVEDADDLTRAVVLGATLGQGWYWGRPGPVPGAAQHLPGRFAAHAPVPSQHRTTPFDLAAAVRTVQRVPKRLLVPLSTTLELAAQHSLVPPMVLSCFQHERYVTPATARRYAGLAQRLPFVAALGEDMPAEPAPGVRGWALDAHDPLVEEWTVLVLGAHAASALVARAAGHADADGDRPFDMVVTHDRALVTAAARAVVRRLSVD